MTINWTDFTPLSALIGGALIGLAAFVLMLGKGRVMGVSGIASGLFTAPRSDIGWRVAFILATLAGAGLVNALRPEPLAYTPAASGALVYVAALLVGIGTAIGSGCTSGHGICGLARLSPRSMVAVGLFMLSAFVTVFVLRHVLA